MPLDAIDHRVAINSAEAAAEEFHRSPIGIHDGKRGPVIITPSTQADPAAGQCRKGAHHWRSRVSKHAASPFWSLAAASRSAAAELRRALVHEGAAAFAKILAVHA